MVPRVTTGRTPEIVKGFRESRGWSREKLAAEAGVSLATVQRLETGTYPRVEHLVQVADALGVSVDEILGRIRQA